jgi:hypothetical protein
MRRSPGSRVFDDGSTRWRGAQNAQRVLSVVLTASGTITWRGRSSGLTLRDAAAIARLDRRTRLCAGSRQASGMLPCPQRRRSLQGSGMTPGMTDTGRPARGVL